MLQTMAQAINQWLHEKGKDVDLYVNFIDRVCDIQEVLSEALDKTAETIDKAQEEKWTKDSNNSDK
jgi:translation initiation factor IF-3